MPPPIRSSIWSTLPYWSIIGWLMLKFCSINSLTRQASLFFEPLQSPAIYSKSCVMCAGLWAHKSLQASTATPVAALGHPPCQDILDLQSPALGLSVFLPRSPCSSIICLPEVKKKKERKQTRPRPGHKGQFSSGGNNFATFQKYSVPQQEVLVHHESTSWQKLALSGVRL